MDENGATAELQRSAPEMEEPALTPELRETPSSYTGDEIWTRTRGGRRGRIAQHSAALLANLVSMSAGVAMGWSSPALPILQHVRGIPNETVTVHLSEEEGSWVSALVPLGAVFGALPAGLMADKFGRKKVLLLLAIPYFCGSLLIIFGNYSVWFIFIGRFITGLAAGAGTVLVPLYCEEIAEVDIRGALGAYLDMMICAGILWIYVLGAVVPYMWFTLSACVIPTVFVLTFIWMPESPVFLVIKGHTGKAKKALERLRQGNRNYDVRSELDNIISSVTENTHVSRKSYKVFCTKHPFRSTTARAVAIVLGLMFFQQLSGINAVIFYTEKIFSEVGSNLSADMSTIIVGVVQLIAVFCSSITVDHLGRRFLLLLSTVVMALCLLCLSLYSHFTSTREAENNSVIMWIPLVTVILYVVVFALGLGPLPWFMMAELLPTHAKGWAGALAVSFSWMIALILTKEFPILIKMSQAITYGILCSFCVLGTIFIVLCVPETKGKTKFQIQEILGGSQP